MKLTLNTKELTTGLNAVGTIIGNHSMPICETVLFHLCNSKLKLTSDNLEIRSSIELAVESTEELKTCVPFALLNTILKGFPNAPVTLDFQKNQVQLICGKSQYKIPLHDAKAFPAPAKDEYDKTFTVNGIALNETLGEAVKYISTDQLNGLDRVLVACDGDQLRVAGTDGIKAYENILDASGDVGSFQLYQSAVNHLQGLLVFEEDVKITHNETRVCVAYENRVVEVLQPTGEFVNYAKMMDSYRKRLTSKLTVDKDAFMAPLRRIANLADKDHYKCVFTVNAKSIQLDFDNKDSSLKASEEVPAQFEGEPLKIGLPIKPLQLAVSMVGEVVDIRCETPRLAFMLSYERKTCLVMPMLI